jgi:hypothetical protein
MPSICTREANVGQDFPGGNREENPIKNSAILKILKFCSKHATSQRMLEDRSHSPAKKTPCAHLGAGDDFWGNAFPGCIVAPLAITVSPDGANMEEFLLMGFF